LLVDRGLAGSLDEARRVVMAGRVSTAGRRLDKPGERLDREAEIRVKSLAKYVSRGGEKLEGALRAFGIDVAGRVCLDAGAATGGFTDCLLQHGAAKVYAVDVGYGQLAWSLRGDPRVELHERTNVRAIRHAALDPRPSLVVADLSFVPLRSLLADLHAICEPGGRLLVMVKPQFELPSALVAGGVVADPELRRQAAELAEAAARELGLAVEGRADSVLAGPDGNVEVFVALSRPR
jgi:23S rRNA (cytidine1920-2'-O)/16S rRNA (cytidine1409-2'-O)-methyltransferase